MQRVSILRFCLVISYTFLAHAEGFLDTTFNVGGAVPGIATTSVGAFTNTIWGAVPQRDGKIVVVGQSDTSTNGAIVVARYNLDGTLDTTFNAGGSIPGICPLDGTGGIPALYTSSEFMRPGRLVTAHITGKIIIGGVVNPGPTSDWSLVCLNANGTIDTTFGINGQAVLTISPGQDILAEVAPLRDGKIMAMGTADLNLSASYTAVRVTATGQVDTTFGPPSAPIIYGAPIYGTPVYGTPIYGTPIYGIEYPFIYGQLYGNGVAAHTVMADPGTMLHAGKVLPNGEIVMFGRAQGANRDAAIVSLDSTGNERMDFGSGGEVMPNLDVPDGEDLFELLSLLSGKMIVVVGAPSGVTLVRVNNDGSLDTSFGTNGTMTTTIGTGNTFHGATLRPRGKIIVGGESPVDGGSFIIAQLNTDGTLDTTFGTDGVIITSISNAVDKIESLITQPGGVIVAVGSSGAQNAFALARYQVPNSVFDALVDKYFASLIHNVN